MITVDKLDVVYGAKEKRNHVVRGVSLTVNKGETLGIVGESGCGKSTLLRSLAGLEGGWTGSISFNGKPVGKTRSRDELKLAQMVFQDPYGSLHPRHRIGRADDRRQRDTSRQIDLRHDPGKEKSDADCGQHHQQDR